MKQDSSLFVEKDNCFLLAVIGTVAMHVYRELHGEEFAKNSSDGITDLEMLTREGLINAPFDYVRRNSYHAFGIDGLPEELYSSWA